jgi:hypothetical protein
MNSLPETNKMNDRKSLAQLYFNLGLLIRPFHSVVNEVCTCKKTCKDPGKHPIMRGHGGLGDMESFLKFEKSNPGFSFAVKTGYYKNLKKSLVIVDVDDPEELDYVRTFIPEIDKTLAVKTKRGWHFWFWCLGSNDEEDKNTIWINTVIGGNGHKVDILAQKRNALVPGSTNKTFHNNNEILCLPEQQIKQFKVIKTTTLTSNKSGSKKNTVKRSAEHSSSQQDLFSGKVPRGQYHDALVTACNKQLRNKGPKIVDGSYTIEKHTEWLCTQALRYLAGPVDLVKVEKIARYNYKKFDASKGLTSEEHFDELSAGLSAESKMILRNVLATKFVDLEKRKKFQCVGERGLSCNQLKALVQKWFTTCGGQGRLQIKDISLMAAFRMFHVVQKSRKRTTVEGKRISQYIWMLDEVDQEEEEEGREEKRNLSPLTKTTQNQAKTPARTKAKPKSPKRKRK